MSEEEMVRVVANLTPQEVKAVCDLRDEPKPSTAVAQIVRVAIREAAAKTDGEVRQ